MCRILRRFSSLPSSAALKGFQGLNSRGAPSGIENSRGEEDRSVTADCYSAVFVMCPFQTCNSSTSYQFTSHFWPVGLML